MAKFIRQDLREREECHGVILCNSVNFSGSFLFSSWRSDFYSFLRYPCILCAFDDFRRPFTFCLSYHPHTSTVIVSHPFCKKPGRNSSHKLSCSIPPTYPSCELYVPFINSLSRSFGNSRCSLHTFAMACVRARPLWKVAEIAGTHEIRLDIRKGMGNALTSPLLIVISVIFVTVNKYIFRLFSPQL